MAATHPHRVALPDLSLMQAAALLGIGLCAGYLSTLLGIGGGLVVVPFVHYGLGVPFVEATAISLLAMAMQTPFGLWTHHRRKAVDWRLGGWLALGGLGGVLVGEWLQPQVPVPWLKLLFAGVMLLAAWRLWARLHEGEQEAWPWTLFVVLGFLAGVTSRLLGIGGGLVTVPMLVLLGVGIHTAVATSLFPVFTNALAASVGIVAGGQAKWWLAVPIALGALATAPLGTRTAHALDAERLRRTFAVAIALAALYVGGTSGAFSLTPS